MPSGMYILECADGSFYTGSTINIKKRLWQHQNSEGANYTTKRLPVKLAFCEPYDRVDDAFRREKQVQGWSRQKKMALIEANYEKLVKFSRNYTEYGEGMGAKNDAKNEQGVFQFTVRQLIDALKAMPQDLPVLTNGYEDGFENLHKLEIMGLKHKPENPYYDGEFQVADGEDAFKAVVLRRVVRL